MDRAVKVRWNIVLGGFADSSKCLSFADCTTHFSIFMTWAGVQKPHLQSLLKGCRMLRRFSNCQSILVLTHIYIFMTWAGLQKPYWKASWMWTQNTVYVRRLTLLVITDTYACPECSYIDPTSKTCLFGRTPHSAYPDCQTEHSPIIHDLGQATVLTLGDIVLYHTLLDGMRFSLYTHP